MADLITRIADNIAELVDPILHAENVGHYDHNRAWKSRRHVTQHPSLLDQLRETIDPANTSRPSGGGAHSKPSSRPPVNLEAVDRLDAIEQGVLSWVAVNPSRPTLEDKLRSLVGFAAQTEYESALVLAMDVARWRSWCRTLAGWQNPPYRPPVPCPTCEAPQANGSGLRVRLDREVATCLSCGSVWDSDELGQLGKYVNLTAELKALMKGRAA